VAPRSHIRRASPFASPASLNAQPHWRQGASRVSAETSAAARSLAPGEASAGHRVGPPTRTQNGHSRSKTVAYAGSPGPGSNSCNCWSFSVSRRSSLSAVTPSGVSRNEGVGSSSLPVGFESPLDTGREIGRRRAAAPVSVVGRRRCGVQPVARPLHVSRLGSGRGSDMCRGVRTKRRPTLGAVACRRGVAGGSAWL